MKNLLCLILSLVALFAFSSCTVKPQAWAGGDVETEQTSDSDKEVVDLFDVSDNKIPLTSASNRQFRQDKIQVVFKQTQEFPNLNTEDFNFDNADSVTYLQQKPTEAFVTEEYLSDFRQIADIYLKQSGRQEVLQAIEYFYSLEYVKYATVYYTDMQEVCTVQEDKLTEEVVLQISQDYQAKGMEFDYESFYGEYDGAYVFFHKGGAQAFKNVFINNAVFKYPSYWQIYVWKDGQIYKLKQAWSNGVISQENLEEITYHHYAYVVEKYPHLKDGYFSMENLRNYF